MDPGITLEAVHEARRRTRELIHRTPLITSSSLDSIASADIVFKCENLQRAGVFKARGAFNAVYSLSAADAVRGVVTSSSGNQAAALSLAASSRGIPAYIAMPRGALKSKIRAVQRYGGNIVWVESQGAVPTSEEYEATAARVQQETGANPVHPYNDLRTIAGQGTCALEIVDERPDLDLLLAPVGGGGLLAGVATVFKALGARTRVIGCEPEMADDACQSFHAGRIVPQRNPRTIADGLRTSLGTLTFPLIARNVDDIVTVTEDAIVTAMRLVWETLKLVIEPSSAVPLAAVLEKKVTVAGKSVAIILTGGNVDLEHLPWRPEVSGAEGARSA
jgi:threonine dehydratase